MKSEIKALYESRGYPAMSHPVSDPALTAVAARMAGLRTPNPASARILEIGCASGHNLLPLAMRWPDTDFTGIDLSQRAIDEATGRAAEAGISNAKFIATDLLDFEPTGGTFDYIIAHGFFSWVPDEVKTALLDFCRRHLSSSGVAFISFNLASGWQPRMPVIAMVRHLVREGNLDLTNALEHLRQDEFSAEIRPVIDDMLAKGPDILPFDDFAPVNDPWPLENFVATATAAGLRWLGESDPAENFPASLGEETCRTLKSLGEEPLRIQTAIDLLTSRTFRSAILCRQDAPVATRISTAIVLEMSVGTGPEAPLVAGISRAIQHFEPSWVPVTDLAARLPEMDAPTLAREVFQGISNGSIIARIEPPRFKTVTPERPELDSFRLLCARQGLPLVDAWHRPCRFPAGHHALLELMDGSRSISQLAAISRSRCPDLDFLPWLDHLTGRGMFS